MWTYRQGTGEISRDGQVIGHGYSGKGSGINNGSLQHIHCVGPIPRGEYEISCPFTSAVKGPVCMHLIAHKGDQLFGRNGFMIHGDNIQGNKSASEGCIILPRSVREMIAESPDHTLEVIA